MSTRDIIHAASGAAASSTTYVDDVFSTYLYTGNSATQTINNGIDLAGNGGLVWIKCRSSGTTGTDSHRLNDTVRGYTYRLSTDKTDGQVNNNISGSQFGITSFNNNGFSLMDGLSSTDLGYNFSGKTYTSWTFRKAPKFFDVVTYTGNGSSQNIAHNLGITPGMIIVKRTDAIGGWSVWHNNASTLYLESTAAVGTNIFGTVNSSTFGVSSISYLNASGGTFVAYLFAHDTAADGLIQCGSVSVTNGLYSDVNLGWEPQLVMLKSSSTTGHWQMNDAMRGMPAKLMLANSLSANISNAEVAEDGPCFTNATGFTVNNNKTTGTYIYLAIRRPNKTPTSGTQVYKSVTRTGTGSVPWAAGSAGFPPDMTIMSGRNLSGFTAPGSYQYSWIDRLRRAKEHIQSINTAAEGGGWGAGHIHNMVGYDGLYSADASYYNVSSGTYVDHHFKRAPGFFDVVCYTGDGTNSLNIKHSLGVVPDMIVVKSRNAASNWPMVVNVGGGYASNGKITSGAWCLNTTTAGVANTQTFAWPGSLASSTMFTPAAISAIDTPNGNGNTYVAYLFATLAGISKVGSYTGNGSSQTINCGFATGARFILIKRTDSTGDWYTWDSARGIVAANDPHLSLNTTVAEVTADDSVDPDNSGFIVNQVAATNINVTSATYIFLAIA